jgi:hypothetical protein
MEREKDNLTRSTFNQHTIIIIIIIIITITIIMAKICSPTRSTPASFFVTSRWLQPGKVSQIKDSTPCKPFVVGVRRYYWTTQHRDARDIIGWSKDHPSRHPSPSFGCPAVFHYITQTILWYLSRGIAFFWF